MIDTQLSETQCVGAETEPEALQNYVQALLARQHSLDLLESIHQQTNEVWATIRRLLETTGSGSARVTPAMRASRAAEAVQAKNSYRSLEQRREECIAALHQAERRANAALQTLLNSRPLQEAGENADLQEEPVHGVSQTSRRKVKNAPAARW